MTNSVLIVGAGKIGQIRAYTARKFSKKTRIYIFDSNFKAARELAASVKGITAKKLEAVLKDPSIQIVVVATPNKYSKNICIQALKNKKHVLLEKPMGRNYKEAKEIYNMAKKYKMKFKCGFNHRYHPAIKEARRLVKEGRIGKILYIRAIYGHGGRVGYEKEWRAKKSISGGGELLDQGSHLIDLCNWFFNLEEIKNTFCIAKPMFWKINVDDNAFVTFETQSGKVAQIHVSWTQWKNKFLFEVYGTKGSIEINGLGKSYGTETLRLYEKITPGAIPKITEKKFKDYDTSWESEWRDFIKSIKSNKKVLSDENESLEVMRLISKLYGDSYV